MSTDSNTMRRTPPGILLIRSIRGKDWSLRSYRYIILLLTFIAYASYHASRKPSSIVKSVLYPESMKSSDPPWPVGNVFIKGEFSGSGANGVDNEGWYPFNGTDGTSKLGEIDVAFLACYSSGMYAAGHLGDTLDLRLFLTTGMIGSGIFVGLFGMGFFWNIHEFWFYLSMQMVAGCFKRPVGLPSWRGSLLAAAVLDYGWGWSFIVPGALIASAGVLVYLFLPAYPEDIGFSGANASSAEEEDRIQKGTAVNVEKSSDLKAGSGSRTSIGLFEACSIPGVIPFALCLFFSKLVAYTFCTGGIVGGILAGYISDKLKARATTAATFMFAAIPSMILYRLYGNISRATNILLMMLAGLFVNGPYALITTAVSADLGTHSSLRGDSRALATVTAIIDGTGSVGAALGPLITGFLSSKGWDTVFMMLNAGALIASLLLSHLIIAEFRERTRKPLPSSHGHQNHEVTGLQPLLSNQR
ncbi:putative glycerol-3-phosphate transporter 4 [Hibiscus syriacus]|uniref:Glycerol-3-phosphate transporter 4 n=1 Tax=Hibiscus syriacus TaxID=106335 RepID=A0A6A2XPC4_HIBSY|nr:putative glycerol-3-phosphate transporter 4 [Hibiscus syriacus]